MFDENSAGNSNIINEPFSTHYSVSICKGTLNILTLLDTKHYAKTCQVYFRRGHFVAWFLINYINPFPRLYTTIRIKQSCTSY